jgi:hypothetical protein
VEFAFNRHRKSLKLHHRHQHLELRQEAEVVFEFIVFWNVWASNGGIWLARAKLRTLRDLPVALSAAAVATAAATTDTATLDIFVEAVTSTEILTIRSK